MELGIDVDDLRKGDVIGDATIRRAIGNVDDPIEFLKLRHFWAENVKTALRKADKRFTVRFVGDDLYILTDPEASRENAKWFDNYRRRMRVRNDLMLAVDRSELSREQQAKHDRQVEKQSAVLAASTQAVRQLPRIAVRRATPAVRPAPRDRRVI